MHGKSLYKQRTLCVKNNNKELLSRRLIKVFWIILVFKKREVCRKGCSCAWNHWRVQTNDHCDWMIKAVRALKQRVPIQYLFSPFVQVLLYDMKMEWPMQGYGAAFYWVRPFVHTAQRCEFWQATSLWRCLALPGGLLLKSQSGPTLLSFQHQMRLGMLRVVWWYVCIVHTKLCTSSSDQLDGPSTTAQCASTQAATPIAPHSPIEEVFRVAVPDMRTSEKASWYVLLEQWFPTLAPKMFLD